LVVLDLIDMRPMKNRKAVETRFRNNLKKDRARTRIGPISQFGLLEMTRQRMRPSLVKSIYQECEHCNGRGYVMSPESVILSVMRRLALVMHRDDVARIELTISPDVAFHILNRKRGELVKLEEKYGKPVMVRVGGSTLDFVNISALSAKGVVLPSDPETYMQRLKPATDTSFRELDDAEVPEMEELEELEDEVEAEEASDMQAESAEDSQAEAQDGDPAEGSKSSRRRRRRSGRRGESTAEDETPPAEAETESSAGSHDQDQDENSEDKPKRRRRRRRGGRGRNKKKGEEQNAEEAAVADSEDASASDEDRKAVEATADEPSAEETTATEPSESSDEAAPKKKNRRRRSRGKKKSAAAQSNASDDTPDSESSADDETPDPPQPDSNDNAIDATLEADGNTKRRKRRSRSKKTGESAKTTKSKKSAKAALPVDEFGDINGNVKLPVDDASATTEIDGNTKKPAKSTKKKKPPTKPGRGYANRIVSA
ncbi:MAG: ribonuclease E/G, partial [Planctomycetota bacterium]